MTRQKAIQAYELVKSPVLVEDSGLIFIAWNNLPGAFIKWFEKNVGCSGLLKMLSQFKSRDALAISCLAIHDGINIQTAKGEINGTIASTIRGKNGFGWDSIFIPEGHDRTFAEMTPNEKNTISHRKRAFENLKITLNT